mgnify:CR=1 FL=1
MKFITPFLFLLSFFHAITAGEITVSTTASKSLVPNYLEWSLQIKSIKPSLDESQAEVVEQLNALIKVLDELNIAAEDRAMQHFLHGKNMVYDNKARKQVQDGFYSSRNLQFKLRDTKAYTTVLKKLLVLDEVTIQRVNFKSSHVEATKESLLIEALKASKIKGEKMANALDMSLGKPLLINEGLHYNPKSYQLSHSDAFAARTSSLSEDNSTALQAIQVDVSVTVVYETTGK